SAGAHVLVLVHFPQAPHPCPGGQVPQSSLPPHPSGGVPHSWPSAAQVRGAQECGPASGPVPLDQLLASGPVLDADGSASTSTLKCEQAEKPANPRAAIRRISTKIREDPNRLTARRIHREPFLGSRGSYSMGAHAAASSSSSWMVRLDGSKVSWTLSPT